MSDHNNLPSVIRFGRRSYCRIAALSGVALFLEATR